MALACPVRASCVHMHHFQAVCSVTTSRPQLVSSARPRSSYTCSASASGDASNLPVVDDATVLPPPATGSQYAWRRSWGGFSASSGSGGGGGSSGRSWQARTRDWGRGPNSSILFVILYRMRLLLLYGVWVTVLYGAFRAVVDLTTAAGKAGYSLVNKAADLLYGTSTSTEGPGPAADAAAVLECSDAAAATAAASTHPDNSTGVAEEGAGSAEGASSGSSSSSGTFATANRLNKRPTATVFEDMMSAVIPVYLMLLGSVVFFASI